MSLLTICQDVAEVIPIKKPTQIVGNNDDNSRILLGSAQAAGKWLARQHDWTAMVKEYTFSTVASQEDYDLTSDYRFIQDQTGWDRSNYEPIRGPLTPQAWQEHKSSVLASTATTWKKYRIRDVSGTRKFSLFPTPDAVESLVFEYLSNSWCRSSGGTDQTSWQADTDVPILDEYLLYLETLWRTLNRMGLPYAEEKNEARVTLDIYKARDGGIKKLWLAGGAKYHLIGPSNVPDTGFGA